MEVSIQHITIADKSLYEQIRDLLIQLYPQRPPVSFEVFEDVIRRNQVRVYAALFDGKIVGTATLIFYKKLCGDVWIIEDVVVDETIRGKGIGKKLTECMLADARREGANMVDLTTRSAEAHRFYIEKCGFKDKAEGRPFWGLRYTF